MERTESASDARIGALDGIRALAVIAVLCFHLELPGFSAGFLGVDAFFVLSGFLITGLLLRDAERHGRVRFSAFWAGRVKRLMPAALMVIAAVTVWALWLPPYRGGVIFGDVLWSLLNLANWHFIATASYFDSDGTTSPLLHFWSLAVEEQFYIVWPLVVALLVLGLRGRPRLAAAVMVVATALAAVSCALLWMLFDEELPERAYMGTDARAFEPLLGAAAAALLALSPSVRRFAGKHSTPILLAGCAGFAGCLYLLGTGETAGADPAYYRGGGLAAAGFAMLMVVGGRYADASVPGKVLAVAPMAYIGRISYGIYLWHWPLIVWLIPNLGSASLARKASVAALTLVVAALSYHLVEQPIRSGRASGRLTPKVLAGAVPMALGSLALAAWILLTGPTDWAVALRGKIVGDDVAQRERILLVGDSVPKRLAPALAVEGQSRGADVYSAAAGSCSAMGVEAFDDSGNQLATKPCEAVVPDLQSRAVEEHRPTLVVWWSRYEMSSRKVDGKLRRPEDESFWELQKESLRAAVDRLASGGAHVILFETDRVGLGIASRCTPSRCPEILDRLMNHDELRRRWNQTLREYARTDPRTTVRTVDDLYCHDARNPCDDRLPDGTLARPDGSHFSEEAMPGVAARVMDRILG